MQEIYKEMRDIRKYRLMGYATTTVIWIFTPYIFRTCHIHHSSWRDTTSPDQMLRLVREMPHLPALLPKRCNISPISISRSNFCFFCLSWAHLRHAATHSPITKVESLCVLPPLLGNKPLAVTSVLTITKKDRLCVFLFSPSLSPPPQNSISA
jgi:hypothetical protein